nr:MAG TPA: hypothetical protein [Caudoviricetes sp.]
MACATLVNVSLKIKSIAFILCFVLYVNTVITNLRSYSFTVISNLMSW